MPDPSTAILEPKQELVCSRFASCAKLHPDHLAICKGKQAWSYGELAECTERLARTLLVKGLERGDVVAVYGPRSFGLIVGLMAVFLSGGVLLLIDPNLPNKRKQLMLQEANAKNLLHVGSKEPTDGWFESNSCLNTFFIHENTGRPFDLVTNPGNIVLPKPRQNDPAYVFFTSGTTGVPKGVLGCHKGLGHFLNWQRDTFDIGPGDRSAQLTGLSFDVVLRDILLPLTSGATLCLPENVDYLAEDILRWLDQERISVLHTVPTLTQSWLAHVPEDVTLSNMRCVFFAGEPLTDTLVQQWRAAFQNGEIINLYGPTETTLAKCFFRVPKDVPPGIQSIGRPMPQTQVLILSEEKQLCDVGVLGEIVLRTPFRSLGYINSTEENQTGFVKNPFRDDEEDLLYFTGDKGQYRPDGTTEIQGRLDHQVKIHGVRIEPNEVSATLGRFPAVHSCLVLSLKDEENYPYLAAYVVPKEPDGTTIPQLRTYLRKHLPAVMVPAAFVFLKELPVTANGKVDRRALPTPERIRQQQEEPFVAPRNGLELQLAKIWEEVLDIRPVGIKDNFFDLGGHSLSAVRLFGQIKSHFNKKLPLATLFEASTVERLADILRGGEIPSHPLLVPLKPSGSKAPLFCVPGLGGDPIVFHKLALYLDLERPFYGLRSQGLLGVRAPLVTIEDIAARFVEEIRNFQPEDPYLLAGYSFGCAVAFEMARQLEAEGQEVAFVGLFNYYLGQRVLLRRSFYKKLAWHLSLFSGLTVKQKIQHFRNILSEQIVETELFKKLLNFYVRKERPLHPLIGHIGRVIIVNLAAEKNYIPQAFSGRVTLFRADGVEHDAELGLPGFAAGGVDVHYVSGGHVSMLKEPHVQGFSEKLTACLNKAKEGKITSQTETVGGA